MKFLRDGYFLPCKKNLLTPTPHETSQYFRSTLRLHRKLATLRKKLLISRRVLYCQVAPKLCLFHVLINFLEALQFPNYFISAMLDRKKCFPLLNSLIASITSTQQLYVLVPKTIKLRRVSKFSDNDKIHVIAEEFPQR